MKKIAPKAAVISYREKMQLQVLLIYTAGIGAVVKNTDAAPKAAEII